MPGMRKVPKGTYRKRGDEEKPPHWWKHWYRDPDVPEPVYLGMSERLDTHLTHRFYPADKTVFPERRRGFTDGVQWLLDLYLAGKDRNEGVTATETEEVREA